MAEISALIPSPPAIGDTHAAPSFPIPSTAPPPPSSSTPEPPKENPIPKSSLYGDKASLTLTVPGETLPSHPPSPKSPKRGGERTSTESPQTRLISVNSRDSSALTSNTPRETCPLPCNSPRYSCHPTCRCSIAAEGGSEGDRHGGSVGCKAGSE